MVTGTVQGVEIELFGKDGVTGMVPGQGEGPEVRRIPTSMILVDQSNWTVSSVLNSGCSL